MTQASYPIKIVKPTDWQFVDCVDLDVVVEGTDRADLECLLHEREPFFALSATQRPVLARVALRPLCPGVAAGRLSGLRPWGSCVLSIMPQGGGERELTASGVNLARSKLTTWLPNALRLAPSEVQAHVRYPLPLVACTISHVGAPTLEPVTEMADLPALLAPSEHPVTVLPLFETQLCDAATVEDLECSLGADDPAAQRLRAASPYQSSAPYLACFADATLLQPAGLVLPSAKAIWSDSSAAALFNDPAMTQYPRMFRALGEPGLVLDEVKTERDILEENQAARLPGLPMAASHIVYGNHAHWMLNSMPPVFWLRQAICDGDICVLVPQLSPYILDSLRSLGIPRASILHTPPGAYRFERLLFPSTLSIHSNSYPPPALAAMFGHIRAGARGQPGGPGAERIYVTRIGSGAQRKMRNEPALIETLRSRGFVCVAPHELSFAEEVRCFAQAKIVVGQLGAGLTNAGFAPPGCHLIEIATHNYTGNDYWFMSYVLKQRFSRIMVRTETQDALTLADFSFDVPLERVLGAIDRAIRRSEGADAGAPERNPASLAHS